jgi:protocatechuate 3,4-dioxygenase beta subunit
VMDSDGRTVPQYTLVEVWQANAAGRYRTNATGGTHRRPQLRRARPNTDRLARTVCRVRHDQARRVPWLNHQRVSAWRPAHIHPARCSAGRSRSDWSPRDSRTIHPAHDPITTRCRMTRPGSG